MWRRGVGVLCRGMWVGSGPSKRADTLNSFTPTTRRQTEAVARERRGVGATLLLKRRASKQASKRPPGGNPCPYPWRKEKDLRGSFGATVTSRNTQLTRVSVHQGVLAGQGAGATSPASGRAAEASAASGGEAELRILSRSESHRSAAQAPQAASQRAPQPEVSQQDQLKEQQQQLQADYGGMLQMC